MASAATVMDVRQEWTTACDVQQGFMRRPVPTVDAVDYSATCRQLHEVGGDCYDFVPGGNGEFALAIGDASGKGLPAALMISNVQSSLRTAALFAGDDLALMIGTVNRHVHATSLMERYATLFYAVFDEASGTMRYVNAGHVPPVLLRHDGSVELLQAGGAPVGMFEDWEYEEGAVRLNPGDVVVACTDGVIEAENERGDQWGMEGLLEAAAANQGRTADLIVDAIVRAMDQFTGGAQTDDVTVLAFRLR